jgi:2-C-methyl-D-erythritol 2,4-cyclodiphosphate synthase
MSETRTGIGYDAHRFGGDGPVVIGGVAIDHSTGVLGTSDADVAAHAICDALLGAAALGDLGTHFPSSDPQWQGADSMDLLSECVAMVRSAGFTITNCDVTVIAQNVRVAPHREAMRALIAGSLALGVDHVSVKATTTDGLGWIGEGEGLAAQAVVTIRQKTTDDR